MIYAVGDIHGKRAMLGKALEFLRDELKDGDYTVFLGDYIDRGEDSKGVIDDLIAFQEEYPGTVFLRGNHEQMMLETRNTGYDSIWLSNGGRATLRSYGTSYGDDWAQAIPESHWAFFDSTIIQHDSNAYTFVHAGLNPPDWPKPTWKSDIIASGEPRLWVRSEFINCDADFGKVVVFGHTPQRSFCPLIMHNKVGLDTAAVFGGRLTVAGFRDDVGYKDGPAIAVVAQVEGECLTRGLVV